MTLLPRPLVVCAGLLALATLCLPVQAQSQWKWRDAAGRITVSDLPPPRGTPDRDILERPDPAALAAQAARATPPAAASAAAAMPKPAVDPELEARKRAAEQQKDAKAKAEDERLAAQRRENCNRARSHLAALDSGQRIARVNDKGEREILDDRQRAAEAQRAREVVASDCK